MTYIYIYIYISTLFVQNRFVVAIVKIRCHYHIIVLRITKDNRVCKTNTDDVWYHGNWPEIYDLGDKHNSTFFNKRIILRKSYEIYLKRNSWLFPYSLATRIGDNYYCITLQKRFTYRFNFTGSKFMSYETITLRCTTLCWNIYYLPRVQNGRYALYVHT